MIRGKAASRAARGEAIAGDASGRGDCRGDCSGEPNSRADSMMASRLMPSRAVPPCWCAAFVIMSPVSTLLSERSRPAAQVRQAEGNEEQGV